MNYFAMMLLAAALTCSNDGYTVNSRRLSFDNMYPGVRKAPVVTRGRGTATPYGGGPKIVENDYVQHEALREAKRVVTPDGAEMALNPYVRSTRKTQALKATGKSQRITFPNGTVLIVSPEFATGSPINKAYMADGLKRLKDVK